MCASPARTSSGDVQAMLDIYRNFHPKELQFLIELNKKWSMYDPNRLENMDTIMRRTFALHHQRSDFDRLITFLNSPDGMLLFCRIDVDAALAQAGQMFHLNPYQSECPICLSSLDAELSEVIGIRVVTLTGRIFQGRVFFTTCKHENTFFCTEPVVNVYPNCFRQGRTEFFTRASVTNGDVVYLGGQLAFERALIDSYTCQLISCGNSWKKFVDAVNLGAFNSNATDAKIDWRKNLAMAFIKYKLIEFDLCIGSAMISIPSSARDFDQWAWDQYPRLLSSFIYLWTNHRSLIGPCDNSCSQCIVVDGHQKCRRRVCGAKQVKVSTEEFDSLRVGCCRTPRFRSKFCDLHQKLEDQTSDKASSEQHGRKKRSKLRKLPFRRNRQHGFGATNCRTMKQRSDTYIQRCSRSFGVLAAVTNCKIVLTFSEIFRSETIREIISLLCSTIRASGFNFPKCGVYDDGCHLVEFIRNHYGRDLACTPASTLLHETKFSVDRTHFRGHVGRWCRLHMNPNKNKMLDGINTQAAEQLFAWLKNYATILSSLGWRKMPIYLLLLFHYKNLERVNIRSTHNFNIKSNVPSVLTVSLAHVSDSEQLRQQKISIGQQDANSTEKFIDTFQMGENSPIVDQKHVMGRLDASAAPFRVSGMSTVSKLLQQMQKLADNETKRTERSQIRRQRKNEARRK